MKQRKRIYVRGITIPILLMLLLLCTQSCIAKEKKTDKMPNLMEQTETSLKVSLGDSIANIILKARNIEIRTDSCEIARLCSHERVILKYIIADSCNFTGDVKVFGRFVPGLYIKFKRYSKVVELQYDFNLHKWLILDNERKLLRRYDLKSDEILRFVQLLLPNDNYIKELNEQRRK